MGCDCCKYGINGDDARTCKAPMKFRIHQGCEPDRGSNYTKPKKKRINEMKKSLKQQYTDACNAYSDALNEMWDTNGEWLDNDLWWFDVADCVISITEVRELVDRGIDFKTFLAWYDYDTQIHYGMEQGHKEALRINLHSWLNGFPEEKKVPKETRDAWEKEYWEKV